MDALIAKKAKYQKKKMPDHWNNQSKQQNTPQRKPTKFQFLFWQLSINIGGMLLTTHVHMYAHMKPP